jgi:cytidylate kinase
MSIFIISSDAREIEENIAKQVAEVMGYQLLNRDILAGVAANYQIDAGMLYETLKTTPSLFKKLPSRQWRYYLASIEADVLDKLLADNIVCQGLAAHLYVNDVSHAMKVRILSGNRQGIQTVAEKRGISLQKAEKWRANELLQRKKWSLAAYTCDETDLTRYDLVINLDQIDPAEAVKTITGAAEYRKFQVMTYSMKCLSDLALAAKVHATLLKSMADIRVQARDGSVVVLTRASSRQKRKKIETIKELAGSVDGVSYVEVHVKKNILGETI